jgi:hypothetical protein
METQLLRDKEIFPTRELFKNGLAESFSVYEEMMETITNDKYKLEPVWRYYNDGKAWLCKVCYKKKTVFWLSVWDKFFKTTFYFTEKTGSGIAVLDIDQSIKEDFSQRKPFGKLIPLTILINQKDQIKGLLKIIEYKKSIK